MSLISWLNMAGHVVAGLGLYSGNHTGYCRMLGLESENGALVSSVHPEGPAEAGSMLAGDVVLSFHGKEIEDMRSLPRIVAETAIGKKVKVKVLRGGDIKV